MKKVVWFAVVLVLLMACEDIIGVEDISNRNVIILAPTNDAILNTTTISFNWDTLDDAEAYKLQIAAPDFENATAIVADTIVTVTNFSKALNPGNYQWRVRAENSGYQTAYRTLSFSVTEGDAIDIGSDEVVLLAPADNLVFSTTDTINLSWETVLNAENYTLQIATPNFENVTEIIENEILSTTSFSVSNLGAQDYEWRVKAQNSVYETNYTTQGFSVEE
jgi:hypothetical protein